MTAHNTISDNTVVGTTRSWSASRFVAGVRVVPASVEVSNVDGQCHDARRLRDAARALTDAADALDRMRRTTS